MDLLTFFLAIILFFCAFVDFVSYKIPNEFIILFILLFFISSFVSHGFDIQGYKSHLIVFFSVLGVSFLLYSFKMMGAGDAKLISVVCLNLPTDIVLPFLVLMALSGAVVALLYYRYSPLIEIVRQKIMNHLVNTPLEKIVYLQKDTIDLPESSAGTSKVGTNDAVLKKVTVKIPYAVAIFLGFCVTLILV